MSCLRFYGWFVVAVAWVLYGFKISLAYYSWGFSVRPMPKSAAAV